MTMLCIPDEHQMLDESKQQATCDADDFDIWLQLSEEEHNMKCQEIGRFYNHPTFSMVVFCPITLCTLFTMYQWWRVETNWKTFPLLLSQCWPLYRLFRLLYLGLWKKEDKKWIEEYDDFKRNVHSCLAHYIVFKSGFPCPAPIFAFAGPNSCPLIAFGK